MICDWLRCARGSAKAKKASSAACAGSGPCRRVRRVIASRPSMASARAMATSGMPASRISAISGFEASLSLIGRPRSRLPVRVGQDLARPGTDRHPGPARASPAGIAARTRGAALRPRRRGEGRRWKATGPARPMAATGPAGARLRSDPPARSAGPIRRPDPPAQRLLAIRAMLWLHAAGAGPARRWQGNRASRVLASSGGGD